MIYSAVVSLSVVNGNQIKKETKDVGEDKEHLLSYKRDQLQGLYLPQPNPHHGEVICLIPMENDKENVNSPHQGK